MRPSRSLLLFCLLALPCATVAAEDALVIGATLPLTGADARPAAGLKAGYDLAFEEINARGGLQIGAGRRKVELRLLDDADSPQEAADLARRLVAKDGVRFLLGTYQGTLVAAQSKVAEEAGVPYVNGGGAPSEIYRQARWSFGLLAPVDMMAYSIMRFVDVQQNQGKLPPSLRVAVLWEKTAHGQAFADGVHDFVQKSARRRSSYSLVFDEPFELGSPDVKGVFARLKAARADVLLADAHLTDFLKLHKGYIAAGLCHRLVTYGARGSEPEARAAFGAESTGGLVSAAYWSALLPSDQSRRFIALYRHRYGTEPEWYEALGYEAARALFLAIEAARELDPEKVRQALAATDAPSLLPGGKLVFANHQAHYFFVVQQNQPGGKPAVVYPLELAQAPGAPRVCPK